MACWAERTSSDLGNRRLDLQYAYDKHGNVSDITDHAPGARQTRGMSYDALDRLIQTTSGSTVFGTASYAYDVLDNLGTVHVSGGSQSRNHTYVYDATTRRLSQVKNTIGGAVVANLTYDVQGNLATKGAQSYQFDLGNRLRSVPGKEASYEYDGHGRRVYAQTVGSGQIQSQYAGSGQLLYQENHKQAKRIDYVYLGNSMVAFRERPISGSTATLKYQHTDALGSPLAVTNAAKALIENSEYEPYGQVVNKPLQDGPGYTGHVQDAATGLTYMQQRYYDPQLGAFLSTDPVTAYEKPLTSFSRYRYASSNPYRYVDPDGRDSMINKPGIMQSSIQISATGSTGSFTSENSQERLDLANKIVDTIRDVVEKIQHPSEDSAAQTFNHVFQPVSDKTGLEIGAEIQLIGRSFYLRHIFVDKHIDSTTGMGYQAIPFGYEGRSITIHTHPTARPGDNSIYIPFSTGDTDWYKTSYSQTHYVSNSNGLYRFNGFNTPATRVSRISE